MRLKLILTLIPFLISCASTLNPVVIEEPALVSEQSAEPPNEVISKEYFTLQSEKGFELKVSEMEDIAFGFVHTGTFSPDADVVLLPEEIDHGMHSLSFRTYNGIFKVEDLYISPHSYTWSPTGKYAVIHNIDYYADAGSLGIVVLNVESGHYIEVTREQIINGKDLGNREKLNIYNIVWLDANRFSMVASAAYLGESEHPGIDFNRKTDLGEKFGNRYDIVLVANWKIEIVNDRSERLDPEKPEMNETLKLLLGKWQGLDDTSSYLTFTNEEIIFSYDNEITNRESYELSGSCSSSEDGPNDGSSDSGRYIYMQNSDTCFYIIDLKPRFLSLSHVGRGNTLSYVQ